VVTRRFPLQQYGFPPSARQFERQSAGSPSRRWHRSSRPRAWSSVVAYALTFTEVLERSFGRPEPVAQVILEEPNADRVVLGEDGRYRLNVRASEPEILAAFAELA
jgi:hypothetical protein